MKILLVNEGGTLCVPNSCMVDRTDGGNLCVTPPQEVWDRSELTKDELTQWSYLISAAGRAMLDVLPQLKDGVINYWEAGNWALNSESEPKGPKVGNIHKKVHMHLVGRSPQSTDCDWIWGEAPFFPNYKDADDWMAEKKSLTPDEYHAVTAETVRLLTEKYDVNADTIQIFG